MNKRLLFVANSASFFISHRLPIACRAAAEGFVTAVAAPADETAFRRLEKEKIQCFPWPVSRHGINPIMELRSVLKLIGICRRFQPDLVHNIAQKAVLYGSMATRFYHATGVINAITGLGYAYLDAGRKQRAIRFVMDRLHAICHGKANTRTIFQNPDDLALFVRNGLVPASQARLIRGSGVDPEVFCPAASLPQPPIVVVPARMLYDKGIKEVAESCRELQNRGIKVRMLLAGGLDARYPNSIPERVLREWENDGLVKWLGLVDNMCLLYQTARIVCLPSYREGIPRALIEAASCAVPIVTTNVPGCREIVRDGLNGLLVPPRSAPELADALQKLLENYELCVAMGNAGRERVLREFSLKYVVEAHMHIYRELLGENACSA